MSCHPTLVLVLRMIFFRRVVPTFRDHALGRGQVPAQTFGKTTAVMARSYSRLSFLAALSAIVGLGATPAAAQFFNPLEALFGPPPRPPSSVPRQQAPQPQPYPQYQDQRYPQQPGQTYVPRQGPIQTQPLPPPAAGTASADPNASPVGLPPGQRPRGTPQPADTSPQPGDEVVAEPPAQKIENKSALFTGLDKITGRIINFDVALGETVQFGALQVTPRACYTRPPTETPNTDAFVEVDEVTLQGEVKRIFSGWVFAASPGLHAVEHPIYDVWLTDCKNPVVASAAVPVVDATATPAAAQPSKPAPAARRSPPPRQPPPPR
jgi:hypothetical protein